MKNSSRSKRLLQRWIVFQNELEQRLEHYWWNVTLCLPVIGIWWLVASYAVGVANPFTFLQWLATNETRLGVALLTAIILTVVFLVGKSEAACGRTILLFLGWLLVMSGVWSALHPTGTAPDTDSLVTLAFWSLD